MAITYLDVDDEITTAAARIRAATDPEVVLVLPGGSRIATSRINFRLLAHEATSRGRKLAIIAPEASTRALAATAGIPVFATVPEYEEARGSTDRPGADATQVLPAIGGAVAAGAAADRHVPDRAPAEVAVAAPPTPGRPDAGARAVGRGAIGATTGLRPTAVTGPARRRRWPLGMALAVGILVLAGAGAAVGYAVLPAATVTLQITAEPVGPITFEGVVDPAAVAVDPATATVPATTVSVPLAATGTFKATGKRVETVAATGRLRWTNCDPTRSYTIRRGTIARTPNGVAFATREDVFLPVAILDPPRIACQSRTVDVEAQREGPGGNVAAGSITVVPGNLNDVVIKVTNPAATSGGLREEFPQVTEEDVAAANAALAEQLDAQLAEVATAPDGVPEGATVYPETAERSEAIPSVPAEDLVGQEVETFELTLTAEGSVVAADPSPLEEIGLARIAAEVPEGMTLREGSEVVEIGEGSVEGQTVHYPVTARAEAYREISEDEVRVLVKGAEAPAAEAALAPYGTAEVVIWPDWAATVTTLDFRLDVTIVDLAPLTPAPATPSPEPGEALPAPTGELVPTPTTEALAPGSGGAGAVAP